MDTIVSTRCGLLYFNKRGVPFVPLFTLLGPLPHRCIMTSYFSLASHKRTPYCLQGLIPRPERMKSRPEPGWGLPDVQIPSGILPVLAFHHEKKVLNLDVVITLTMKPSSCAHVRNMANSTPTDIPFGVSDRANQSHVCSSRAANGWFQSSASQ